MGKALYMGVRLCVLFDPRHHHYCHNSTLLGCTSSRSDRRGCRVNTRLHDFQYTPRPFKALDESTRASPYGLLTTSVRSFLFKTTLVYHTTISSAIR